MDVDKIAHKIASEKIARYDNPDGKSRYQLHQYFLKMYRDNPDLQFLNFDEMVRKFAHDTGHKSNLMAKRYLALK